MPTSRPPLPSHACHNCRRRRWRCDKSLPVCQKCIHSGTDCLGYGKLLIWNNGVASRGKMMGKTFEALDTRTRSYNKSQPDPQEASEAGTTMAVTNPEPVAFADPDSARPAHTDATLQWALVDPLVKDLDAHSRYYLYHFAIQICSDIVILDGPGRNPIRDLIPATSTYSLLRHVIIANSALHVHNLSQQPLEPTKHFEDSNSCITAYKRAVTRFGGPFQSSYRDALVAKQSGLALLCQSLQSVNESNFDILLAAVILFINYDLIESGKDSWKVHFEGARKLINLLGDPHFTTLTASAPMSRLRTCLLADSLVFFIIGSTLTFSTSPTKLIPDNINLDAVLSYAETHNYLSCPAPLLRIMLQSFGTPDAHENRSPTEIINIESRVRALLEAALSFNPETWASTLQPTFTGEDLAGRIRIATAHRAAVCLYIARVLPNSSSLLHPLSPTVLIWPAALATEIVDQLRHINPGDPVFKSISWALFLAGCESEIPEERVWIMEKLYELWKSMCWGYMRTAIEVLKVIWRFKDGSAKGWEVCWVDEIKRMEMELLIA